MAGRQGITSDDRAIGIRLRWARLAIGATCSQVGEVLGISEHQIQNYERGRNRISAGQLIAIARAFKIPLARLFGTDTDALVENFEANIQLLKHFSALDSDQKRAVIDFARALAPQGLTD